MNYGELVANKNNKEYVEAFFKEIYENEIRGDVLLRLFTVEELTSFLFDDVLGKYFRVYYENAPFEFVFIFKDTSLEIAYQVKNEEILKYCFGYFLPRHTIIVDFLREHFDASKYLLNGSNLFSFLNWNKLQNKPFLADLPNEFISQNIDFIIHVILSRFFNDVTRFLDELADTSFFSSKNRRDPLFLEKIISRCTCGEGRELVSFLNQYQEHYSIDLELYRREILEVLFSHESMRDKRENPYLESLEMILDEVLHVQNLTINDIKYLKAGSYSDVYQIGDFVLKVGSKRNKLEIPSHKNVLRPIFRRYLSEIDMMVEIVPKVLMIDKSDWKACQTLFYLFYEDGNIMDDIHPQNIGRYRSVKDKYFKDLYISNGSIGFLGENYEEPKEGEYVLIDSDYLEYKETCDIEKCQSREMVYKYIKEYRRRNQ